MTDEPETDFSPKHRHRIEIGENTTPGGFFTIAHPQSAFAGPCVASFNRDQAREIYEQLGRFFDDE